MAITRTTTFADVVAEKLYKDATGQLVTDIIEETIMGCDTRQKADIILAKEHKGAIVTIQSISFRSETRKMSDDDFYSHSEVVKSGYLDEEELKAKAENRRKKQVITGKGEMKNE